MTLVKKISFDAASIPVIGEVWWSYTSTFGDTDEIPEYDSSSDEEQVEESAAVLELDRASTFVVGVSTRFGRQVRINNRLIS